MADVRAFSCIRPGVDVAHRVASLPYDVYNREEAKAEVLKEPLAFLKIDRAETQFEDGVDIFDSCVYEKARDTLWSMVEDGIYVWDRNLSYYIYELTMDGRSQTGISACVAIDDYLNGVVKKHENTREDKEIDRIRHVDVCDAQTGPIFLAYRSNSSINDIVDSKKKETALYDFISDDGVTHRVWEISDAGSIQVIQEAFSGISSIYIADGHHRAASAVKVGIKRREEHPRYTGDEEFNYFLAVLFPDEQLKILDYNRVVKDLNGLTKEEFLQKVSDHFGIEEIGDKAYQPDGKGKIGMYLKDTWYMLTIKPEYVSNHPVAGLDVSILQEKLLSPILGIDDPKTNKRIDFVGGIRGLMELEKRVHSDCQVAFSLYPTSIEELIEVSDANLLMPPKSTWFEPKLRSGLFIHSLNV